MILNINVSENYEYQTWMVSSNAHNDKFCIALDQPKNSATFEQEIPAMDFLFVDQGSNLYHIYVSFTSFGKDCWHVQSRKNINQSSNSQDLEIDYANGNRIKIEEDNKTVCIIKINVESKKQYN